MKLGCIYVVTVDWQEYVGRTFNFRKRKYQHLRAETDSDLHFAIRANNYQADFWVVEDQIPEDIIEEREEYWISYFDTFNKGLNMSPKGYGMIKHKQETIDKISLIQKEKAARGEAPQQRPEVKIKLSQGQQKRLARGEGPSQRPESKLRISTTKKKRAAEGKLPQAKLTPEQVKLIRLEYEEGMSKRALSKKYNVSPPCIANLIKRKTWNYIH